MDWRRMYEHCEGRFIADRGVRGQPGQTGSAAIDHNWPIGTMAQLCGNRCADYASQKQVLTCPLDANVPRQRRLHHDPGSTREQNIQFVHSQSHRHGENLTGQGIRVPSRGKSIEYNSATKGCREENVYLRRRLSSKR